MPRHGWQRAATYARTLLPRRDSESDSETNLKLQLFINCYIYCLFGRGILYVVLLLWCARPKKSLFQKYWPSR